MNSGKDMTRGSVATETTEPPIAEEIQHYFVNLTTSCPYGLPGKAVYHQASFGSLDDALMGRFLANGFRRNGNCMYSMLCPGCRECVPIRLRPADFRPNRNQRRTRQKNLDLTTGIAPLHMGRENLALLDKFLTSRFPGSKGNALDYYSGFFVTSLTRCMEIRYRLNDQLVGVAIVDYSADWLNAVYFYFDPELPEHSPGTFNILYLIDFCRSHHIEHLYLGYWLASVAAMRYKSRFLPHQLLLDGKWQIIDRP